MKKKLCILFDLDGTLLDTAPEFTHCLNTLLTSHQRPEITIDHLRPYVAKGARGMCQFGFPDLFSDQFEVIVQSFLARYLECLGQNTKLFDGMVDTIDTLVAHHIPWGIVTNKHERFAIPLIKKFEVLSSASVIVCGDTTNESKPSPKPLLHAATMLNIAPQQCWYVGDAKSDVDASKAAGMFSAIANYGYLPPDEDAQSWRADKYINVPQELLGIIARLS